MAHGIQRELKRAAETVSLSVRVELVVKRLSCDAHVGTVGRRIQEAELQRRKQRDAFATQKEIGAKKNNKRESKRCVQAKVKVIVAVHVKCKRFKKKKEKQGRYEIKFWDFSYRLLWNFAA